MSTSSSSHEASRVPVTGVVLAGGRSRRMGTDKALISVGGEALVTRVAGALDEVCEHVMVVAGDAAALAGVPLPEGCPVIADREPFLGPLGGLETALEATETDWVFAAGVDMPFLEPAVVRLLWEALLEAASPHKS